MTKRLEPPFLVPRDRPLHPIAFSSSWTDMTWQFDDRTPGQPANAFQIRWDCHMPHGTRFDEPEWSKWREAVKIFVWSVLADPPEQGRALRFGSVSNKYQCIRVLVRWMVDKGYRALSDLDQDAQQRFIDDIAKRKGRGGRHKLKLNSLKQYEDTLHLLHLQGLKYPQLAIDEPPISVRISRPRRTRGKLPYTPEEIAVPLVLRALRLVEEPADNVIALRSRAQAACDATLRRGKSRPSACNAVLPAISGFAFTELSNEVGPWYPHPITSTEQISYLVNRIYDACFVLISYLVGMRASEILGLEVGCFEHERSIDLPVNHLFINGRIYKTASVATGDPHRWIAPKIAERVIKVLESLSAPLRARSGRPHLWLTTGNAGMIGPDARIDIVSGPSMIRRLNEKFAKFIDLPTYQGNIWHLTTHQGRKSFARFVAKQDRTGLHALKSHFGHRSIIMTDQGYAGSDYEISELISEAAQEEMVFAYADSLTADRLAGAAGEKISAHSQFRGQLIEEGASEYARRQLTGTNVKFVVCDYGFCYYVPSQSACHGDDRGPNPAFRTESTCVGCKNCVVAPQHLSIWKDRRESYVNFLQSGEVEDPDLHNDFKAKIAECDQVIAQLRSS